jgi:hypothetical protein
MRRVGRGILRAVAASLVAVACGSVGVAMAELPNVAIGTPLNGSVSNDRTPSFSGVTNDPLDDVTLSIYAGSTAGKGEPVQTLTTPLPPAEGTWSVGPAETLTDGVYTAQATQTNLALEQGASEAVTFTVETAAPRVTLNSPKSPSNDTRPLFTGTASDTTAVVIQIYAGSVAEGPVVSTASATGTGAAFTSGDASPALPSGQYTAVATQESSLLGNPTGVSEPPVTFTVDTASPTVTLSQTTPLSNDTTPSFTGFASETTPVTIQIYAGATAKGSVISTATATGNGGDWSSGDASPALSSGQYTAIAVQESPLGNPAGVSEPETFRVETAAPRVTLKSPKSPSNDTTPSFTGTASETSAVVIQIYAGSVAEGSIVSTATATGTGGAWASGDASPKLPSGQYTAIATQESESSLLGNPAGVSEPVTFTVDTASPVVTLNQTTPLSNHVTPSFTGAASETTPVTIQIYAGATATGSVVSSATATGNGGDWSSGGASPALASGQYTAIAIQESPLGNPAGVSEPETFTVETAAPRVTLNSPALRSNNTTPAFTGTASDTTPVNIDIYAGAAAKGSIVSSATATDNGGAWTSADASPALASGKYTAIATQESSLGNPTGTSSSVTFVVDTTSPTVTLEQPPGLSNHTTPSFTGTGSDTTPITVEVYAGATAKGAVVSSATAPGTGGAWTSGAASPALASGQYTAVAAQESSLGNPTGVSSPVTFTVDTASPTVTLKKPPSPSNDTTPSFTGTGSDTTPVTVDVYAGATAKGAIVSSATATGTGGAWSSGAASPALASGQYTAVARQESSLGNPTGVSSSVTFVVDTASPTVTLKQPLSPSNNTTPSFTGSASDSTPVVVRIFLGASEVSSATATVHGGSWTSGDATPALSSGKHTYTAVASQESSLGNPPGTSAPVTFAIDTTAPAVTLNQPVARSNNATPSFSGSASDTTAVTVQIYAGVKAKGTVVATATAPGTGGAWTSADATPALSQGKHTYTAIATQASSLGNPTGTSSPVTFAVDTEAPSVTLNAPASQSNDTTPSFTGSTSEASEVIVHIYNEANTQVAEATAPAGTGDSWTSGPTSPALSEGRYRAVASQESLFGNHVGETTSASFTVDITPPHVTLTDPANGSSTSSASQLVSGAAGKAPGDLPAVTVQLFSGSAIVEGQAPLQSITVDAAGGAWSATFAGLGAGSYSVRALQSDEAGNLGVSAAAAFTVTDPAADPAPAAAAAPAASFSWSPAAPHTGESISLLSSSTDASSPITAFAWELAGSGPFAPGGPVISTSFSTAGRHLVQLRVTDANGLSSVAAEVVDVTAPPAPLMRPFPIVRITTTARGSTGARLTQLSVLASAGARITVECKGRGCPVKSQTRRVVAAGKVASASVGFRRFERFLPDGVTLEVRVSRPGEIGKYTRFAIRRGSLPLRIDTCLGPAGVKPMACPSS